MLPSDRADRGSRTSLHSAAASGSKGAFDAVLAGMKTYASPQEVRYRRHLARRTRRGAKVFSPLDILTTGRCRPQDLSNGTSSELGMLPIFDKSGRGTLSHPCVLARLCC